MKREFLTRGNRERVLAQVAVVVLFGLTWFVKAQGALSQELGSIAVLPVQDSAVASVRFGRGESLSVQVHCQLRGAIVMALSDAGVSAEDAAVFDSTADNSAGSLCPRGVPTANAVRRASDQFDVSLSVEIHSLYAGPRRGATCSAEVAATWTLGTWTDGGASYSWTDTIARDGLCGSEVDGIVRVLRAGTTTMLAQSAARELLTAASGTAASRVAVREALRAEEELATWGRPAPPPASLVIIERSALNPASEGSILERVQDAVVTLIGPDRIGSAFIVSADGLTITNRHVVEGFDVEGAVPLRARFANGREVPARVLRVAETLDAALVQVVCEGRCRTLPMELTTEPTIGEDVYVVGTPRQLEFSVSRGIVSSIRFSEPAAYLQTDAAVNPGNSGGPMIHAGTGRAVAVITFIYRESEGLNFGIAVQDVVRSLGVRVRQ